ncbi:GNAT family N-acetyltransferase [Parasedimentitalea maritima]|uniref:GNAT family N-acetyltransferase n=1 Tax=Parasedimentitalea maritima TaxID=2578117 RepID=UPI001FE5DCAE
MIRDHFQNIAETYIAELSGQPVRFVALMGNEIGGLFLHPSYHGRGIGKALVDKAVEVRGELHLEVFKANPVGRRFYQKYGFVEGAEKMDPFFGHWVLELTYSP